MKLLKVLLVTALAFTSSFALAGVDLSTTVTSGGTKTVTNLNTDVTGSVTESVFEYHQNRGSQTIGTVDANDSLTVGIDVTATLKQTSIDQHTGGYNTTRVNTNGVAVSVGPLTNAQGTTVSRTTANSWTQNDNLTTIASGTVSVSTITEEGYTAGGASKLGNDFTANINGVNVNSEGNSVNISALSEALLADVIDVTVSGQDLNLADMNGLAVETKVERLQVVDKSNSATTGTTVSTTDFERLY